MVNECNTHHSSIYSLSMVCKKHLHGIHLWLLDRHVLVVTGGGEDNSAELKEEDSRIHLAKVALQLTEVS